ncbi:lysosomal Pro-X carboxypeptidase-like [Rhodamnia argentea]|uniref:Lysosomal Pro-X carboxypeptidase-like n=1 Tax=Rhodamnia argentea TaxID=178133 RepID=A0A8B8NJR7_9MYRT|nr:lysosomal Pro-X carboxypeptidase-like [Rhodamnia argentea]
MTLSRLYFIISFILSAASISGHKLYTPTLSLQRKNFLRDPERAVSASVSNDFETFFFNQTLDHFNYRPESYTTFRQRYLINSKYWGGANSSAPIFVYLGAEEPIDEDLIGIGFLTDNAAQFKALLVYIEHRYYGESIPLGMSFEEALKDANVRGYFSSAQALADYAAIILHMKQNLKARDSPVIVVGGSYGGMLASWFRLKYPHVTLGALASSAPILYFDDITPQDAYYWVVTKDFKEASETCYQAIGDSWSEIDRVAQEPNGTANLSKMFKTCKPLKSGDELKDYLTSLYAGAAQYDDPVRNPVTVICNGIDGANTTENGVLGKIFAGVVAYHVNSPCYVNPPTNVSETDLGWGWQRCSEMVMPIGITNNSMFPSYPFVLSSFIDECNSSYGVVPRPHWVTTYYGGHDIELILLRFGSNIIFSNGLRDPYSSAGVLKNISDSIIAVYTEKGSHCLDILAQKQTDPDWLVMQRKTEIETIKGWLATYYADLLAFKQ